MSGFFAAAMARVTGLALGLCMVFSVQALSSDQAMDTSTQAANDDFHVIDLGTLPRGPSTIAVSVPIELDRDRVEKVSYRVDCACVQVVDCPTTLTSDAAPVLRLSFDVPASPGPINHFVRLRGSSDVEWEYVVHLTGSVQRQESCVPSGVLLPSDTSDKFEFAVLVFGEFGAERGDWTASMGDLGSGSAGTLSVREDSETTQARSCRRLVLTLRGAALELVRRSAAGYLSIYLRRGASDSDDSLAARYEVRVEALRPPPDSRTLERAALRVRNVTTEGGR